MSEDEKTICSGSPSQVLNLKSFTLSFIVIAAIVAGYILFKDKIKLPVWILALNAIPFISMLWKFLQVKCLKYELTNERIKIFSGVFNRTIEEIELYRVKDLSLIHI